MRKKKLRDYIDLWGDVDEIIHSLQQLKEKYPEFDKIEIDEVETGDRGWVSEPVAYGIKEKK